MNNRIISQLILGGMVLFVVSCLPKSFKSMSGSGNEKTTPPADTDPNGENASTPQPVTGVYLVSCNIDKYPIDSDKSARVPCRLEDAKTLAKVDPSVAITQWKFLPQEGSLVRATQTPLPPESMWHVQFDVTGPDANNVLQSVQGARVGAITTAASKSLYVENTMTEAIAAAPADVSVYKITDARFTHIKENAMSIQVNPPGKTEYICIAEDNVNHNLNPGCYIPGQDGCYFAFGSERMVAPNYHFFALSPSYTWVSAIATAIPQNAVNVGVESNGTQIYACKGQVDNAQVPGIYLGKIGPGYGGCDIALPEGKKQIQSFEIMVIN